MRKKFTQKCLIHEIPEDIINLFLALTLKDEENLKKNLSEIIAKNSEKYFEIKVSAEFFLEILNLILNSMNHQLKTDFQKSQSKKLIIQTAELLIAKFQAKINLNPTEGVQLRENDNEKLPEEIKKPPILKKVFIGCLELFFSINNRNVQKIFINIIDIIENLRLMDLKELKRPIVIFDFLKVLLTKPTSENIRKSIEILMEVMNLKESTRGLITLLLFSPLYNVGIQQEDKSLESYNQLYYFFQNIVAEIEKSQEKHGRNDEDLQNYIERLSAIFLFFFRSTKLHFTEKDYKKAFKVVMEGFDAVLAKPKEEGGLSLKKPEKELMKLQFKSLIEGAAIIGNIIMLNKDFENELDELAQHYEISIQTIKELILLISDYFWQNFFRNRYEALTENSLLKTIAKIAEIDDINFLIGYMALINGDNYSKYLYDFCLGLIFKKKGDSKKKSFYVQVLKEELIKNPRSSTHVANAQNEDKKSLLNNEQKNLNKEDSDARNLVEECLVLLRPLFNVKAPLFDVKASDGKDNQKLNWRNLESNIDKLSDHFDLNREVMKYFTLIFVCPKKSFKKQIKEGIAYFLKDLTKLEKEVGLNQILNYILQCDKFFTGKSIAFFFKDFLTKKGPNEEEEPKNNILFEKPNILMRSLLDMKSNWASLKVDDFLSVFATLHENQNLKDLQNLPHLLERKYLDSFLEKVAPVLNDTTKKKLRQIQGFFLTDEITEKRNDSSSKTSQKNRIEILSSLFSDCKKEFELAYKLLSIFSATQEPDAFLKKENEYSYLFSLKYFFTKEPFAFADQMVSHFNNFNKDTKINGNDFGSIFSLFSGQPKLKGAKKILNEPKHLLKFIVFIRDIHMEPEKGPVVERVLKNDNRFLMKICKLLKLDYNELTYFLKFLFCSLKFNEIAGFLRTFGFDNYIKIELMTSLLCFFKLNEEDLTQKSLMEQLMKSTASRHYLYSLLKIEEPEFFNLIYDMRQGNFWNISEFLPFFFLMTFLMINIFRLPFANEQRFKG